MNHPVHNRVGMNASAQMVVPVGLLELRAEPIGVAWKPYRLSASYAPLRHGFSSLFIGLHGDRGVAGCRSGRSPCVKASGLHE